MDCERVVRQIGKMHISRRDELDAVGQGRMGEMS